jgi:hypothetical protein
VQLDQTKADRHAQAQPDGIHEMAEMARRGDGEGGTHEPQHLED